MKIKLNKFTALSTVFLSIITLIPSGYSCNNTDRTIKTDTTKKQNNNEVIKFVNQGEAYFQDKDKKLIKQIEIEVAETEERRRLGLMFRQSMEENQGMLFIFPNEELQSFWMKNTVISLDIIYINSKKQIVKIHKKAVPFDERGLPSGMPSKFVIEVNGGFCEKFGIKEGDYIDYRRN